MTPNRTAHCRFSSRCLTQTSSSASLVSSSILNPGQLCPPVVGGVNQLWLVFMHSSTFLLGQTKSYECKTLPIGLKTCYSPFRRMQEEGESSGMKHVRSAFPLVPEDVAENILNIAEPAHAIPLSLLKWALTVTVACPHEGQIRHYSTFSCWLASSTRTSGALDSRATLQIRSPSVTIPTESPAAVDSDPNTSLWAIPS